MLYYIISIWCETGIPLRPALMPPPTIDYYCYYSESVRTILLYIYIYIFSVYVYVYDYIAVFHVWNTKIDVVPHRYAPDAFKISWLVGFTRYFFLPLTHAAIRSVAGGLVIHKYNKIYVNIVSLYMFIRAHKNLSTNTIYYDSFSCSHNFWDIRYVRL